MWLMQQPLEGIFGICPTQWGTLSSTTPANKKVLPIVPPATLPKATWMLIIGGITDQLRQMKANTKLPAIFGCSNAMTPQIRTNPHGIPIQTRQECFSRKQHNPAPTPPQYPQLKSLPTSLCHNRPETETRIFLPASLPTRPMRLICQTVCITAITCKINHRQAATYYFKTPMRNGGRFKIWIG